VACEADEELPHLLRFVGEDKLIIGSDYGHNDPSKEPQFVAHMRAREDVPPEVIEKILCDNPRQLYGLTS
jgi:predicted TIM-barrel fold metal-dependent hydrolase